MATVKSIPRRQRLASYRGRYMVDTVRGIIRVRKWPKKRGPPKSERQRYWVDWFRQANLLAKYADAATHRRAIELTKHTGLYPRDIVLQAMRGRLYTWIDDSGWKWYPVAAIQDISESLDVLAQTVGSVLVRATDRWRAPAPAAINDVLTYKGAAAPPEWQTPAAGGVSTGNLPGTPIVVDDTVSEYFLDVSGYASFELTLDSIVLATSQPIHIRLSTDGGSSYHSGGTDYRALGVNPASDYNQDRSTFLFNDGATAAAQHGTVAITNLRAGRCALHGIVGFGTSAQMLGAFANFDGPITNLHIFASGPTNFETGTIRATGFAAA